MQIFPDVEGTLEERSPAELLRLVEEKRVTGVLELNDGPRRFEIVLRGGAVVGAETSVSGLAPVEGFLAQERGRYRLGQRLLLPDGKLTAQMVASGELAGSPPPAIVRVCEAGGLTGTLRIRHEGQLFEALFDAGVLTAITLDGHQSVDLHEAWRWTSGEWAIRARPALEPPPDPADSGLELLRHIEVAAIEFLDGRCAGDQPGAGAAECRDDERTIKVVYLDTAAPSAKEGAISSRYSDTDVTGVVVFKRPRGPSVGRRGETSLPTPGAPIARAAPPPRRPRRQELEPEQPAPAPGAQREAPWTLIAVAVLLLSLIGALLYLLSASTPE